MPLLLISYSRFSSDRVAKKINDQSKPKEQVASDDEDEDAPSQIPLFNTSVPGRPTKPQRSAQQQQQGSDGELEPDLRMYGGGGADEGPAKKKKGGLKEKVKKAKDSLKEDEAKSDAKLGKGRRKGAFTPVLKGADYLKMHEKTVGKKRFR